MTSEYRKRPITSQPPVPEELLDPAKRKSRVQDHYKKLKTCSSENYSKAAEETQNLYQIIIQKFQDPSEKLNLVNECFGHDFCAIVCKLIEKSYQELEEFFKTRDAKNAKDLELLEALVYRCNSLICTFNEYAQLSAKFIKQAYENEILKHLFCFLKNEKIFAWIFDQAEELAQIKKPRNELISIILDAFANLVRLSSDKWEKNDAVKVLLKIPEKLTVLIKNNCELLLRIVLANLASQNEIDQFIAPDRVVKDITDVIKCISMDIKNQTNVRRIRINLEANSNESHDIAVVRYNESILLKFVELADALYHMACNDSIKQDIYEKYEMKAHLKDIIYHGNEIEQEYALKILWQLCFNSHVARDVRLDDKLVKKIDQLKSETREGKNKRKIRPGLVENCKGILWRIGPVKQIMISYNSQSRDMCENIKSVLEAKGYKVWFDVNDLQGRCLEEMAKAVEESMCILLCVTEQYYLSPYCRSEAEYTYSRRKPYIPLMMQKNYKPESWLGILIAERIYVNFTLDFKECIVKLDKEIQKIEESLYESIHSPLRSIQCQPKRNEYENWTSDQVEKWLNDKKISQTIKNTIFPCNGRFLEQLHRMEEKNNEIFYKALYPANYKEIICFAIELRELNC